MKYLFVAVWCLVFAPLALADSAFLGKMNCPLEQFGDPPRKLSVGFWGAPADVQEFLYNIDEEACDVIERPARNEIGMRPDILMVLLEGWQDISKFPKDQVAFLKLEKLASKSGDDFMSVSGRTSTKSGRLMTVVALNLSSIREHFVEHAVYALMYRAAMVVDWNDESRRALFSTDDLRR